MLKPLDVLFSVNGRAIGNSDEAVNALNTRASPEGLTLGYDRVVKGAIERRTVRVP